MSRKKLPYIFLGSAPIGPIALQALELAKYPPIKVIDDPKLPEEDLLAIIEDVQPTFLLVVGFGAILKRSILDSVAGQVLNIHPSLLPEYRGPAPVVQMILDDCKEAGVSLMEIDPEMDHGPLLAQAEHNLRGDELPEELYSVLTRKGVDLFLQNIDDYLDEELVLTPQNHIETSFSHFIKKEDGLLDLTLPGPELERKIRAFQGWPRSWIIWKNKRLIIDKAYLEQGKIRFLKVQPEGSKLMSLEEFCRGQRIGPEEFYKLLHI